MKFSKKKFLLFFLFLISFILRTYNLSNFPVGFHGDEAEIGYNAYSLLKTGRDKNGVSLPLSTDQFGDFRPAGYHYLAMLPIALFGLNEFSTRLPGAIFGSFTVIIIFFLIKEIFTSEKIALTGTLILTFNPWHIVTSRATSESIIALFFVVCGAFVFLKTIKKKQPNLKWLILSFFFLGLTFLFYHAARFFVPLFAIFLTLAAFLAFPMKQKVKKHLLILNLLLLLSGLFIFIASRGFQRPFSISIFKTQETQLALDEQLREDSTQNIFLSRFFHNKPINYFISFLYNYSQHFTVDFLFLKGGFPHRYVVPWIGNFYLVEAPFLILGFTFLLANCFKKRDYLLSLPIFWTLAGVLPAALTFEDIPNVQRSIMMLPGLIIIIAYGFNEVIKLINQQRIKRIFILIISAFLFYNFSSFLHNYFHHSLTHQPWYRSVGEKELVFTLEKLSAEYEKIVTTSVNDNNLVFHLFYRQIDPKFFQKMGSPKDKDGLQFQNLTFLYAHCPLEGNPEYEAVGKREVIYVNRGECPIPKNAQIIKTIKRTDATDAFQILKLKE